jgi:hypothetical protein
VVEGSQSCRLLLLLLLLYILLLLVHAEGLLRGRLLRVGGCYRHLQPALTWRLWCR